MPEHPIESVLNFWFGTRYHKTEITAEQRGRWFGKSRDIDEEITQRFHTLLSDAGAGALDHLHSLPKGHLAVILLLDQFSRHRWRDSADMYQFDPQALALATTLINDGGHKTYAPIEQVFLYLPLEHAEDLTVQAHCVALFSELVLEVPSASRPGYEEALRYAEKHWEIIERFGRFPHRNELLGRSTTPEEEEFLKTPGSRF